MVLLCAVIVLFYTVTQYEEIFIDYIISCNVARHRDGSAAPTSAPVS